MSELNAWITRRTSLQTDSKVVWQWCADCGEEGLHSQRRGESFLNLVAEVRALIGEPSQNGEERGEILVQGFGQSPCVRFLARSQNGIAREVESPTYRKSQQLGHALSMDVLEERARNV